MMQRHLRALTALLSVTFVLAAAASQAGTFTYTIWNGGISTTLASVTLDQLLNQGYWIEEQVTGPSWDVHLGFQNWVGIDVSGINAAKVAVSPEEVLNGFGLAFTSARQFQAAGGATQDTKFKYDVVALSGSTAPTKVGLTLGGHYTGGGGSVTITDTAEEVGDGTHTITAGDPGSMEAWHALNGTTDTIHITKEIKLVGGTTGTRPRTTKLTRFDQWIHATDPVPESSAAQLSVFLGLGGLALLRRRSLR